MDKRICKKCGTGMAKELAICCSNCRRVFCMAHLVAEPLKKTEEEIKEQKPDWYCVPCFKLKYGSR